MSKHIAAAELRQVASLVSQPNQGTIVDRSFELPSAVYLLTIGAYFTFVMIMAATFGNPELAIPMVICVAYITMAFGVPSMWTQIGATNGMRCQSWGKFRQSEFSTNTGPVSANSALVQILVLPCAILLWSMAIAIIVAVLG